MAIDIHEENLISLSEAAALLPGRPSKNSVVRWHLRGVKGVRLETVMLGGRRFTSEAALQRFAERTTAAANGETPPARTAKQRERAIRSAERELDAAGI